MTAAPAVSATHPHPGGSPRSRTWTWVGLLALGACLAWTPFLGRSLSPDEAGFLMVGGQWEPGTSLYGDYWVDRPPGLVALFALADLAGGAWAVRALGLLAVLASVLLAGLIGRLAAPADPRAPLLPAATAAVFLATPLFGGGAVNGEVLGLPFLLAGAAGLLAARAAPSGGRALAWALAAGAAGAAAVLVKQSLVDVFLLALVLLGADLATRRATPRAVATVLTGVVAGGVALGALAVALAVARGTGVGELWDAVVVFRGEAAQVILDSATDATPTRLRNVGLAMLAAGTPLLAYALGRRARHAELRLAALAVLALEAVVLLVSGSYWLHYLTGLVLGMVLLSAAAAQRRPEHRPGHRPDHLLRTAYALAVVSAAITLVFASVNPVPRSEEAPMEWLKEHARPGETGVVAFGAPNILHGAGLSSPYPDLWSLPVRVHDPELDQLSTLLASPRRPDWLVVYGRSLSTWGVDGRHANKVMADHYESVATTGEFTVHRRRDQP